MQPSHPLTWVGLLALATLACAVFATVEVAVVRARRAKLEKLIESGTDPVEAAMRVDRELVRGLLSARAGALLAAAAAGWAGAAGLSPAARRLFGVDDQPFSAALVSLAVYAVIGIAVSAFGHAAPRSLALRRPPEAWTRQGILSRLFTALALPFAAAGMWLGAVLGPKSRTGGEALSEDELNLLILTSYRRGKVGAAQRELIARVFGHAEDRVRDVMTPRSAMACIPSSMRVGDALQVARQFGFTRFPVCEGGKDRVIGVVHYRDLVDAKDANARLPVTDVMRPAVGVAADLAVSEALAVMQQNRAHMAVVTDETGASLGLVTIEDLLSNMVSEPSPQEPPGIREMGKGIFELSGDLLVEEVEDALDVDLQHVGVESISSYLFDKLGRRPKEGDSIKIAGVVFDVLEVRGARIKRLRAQRTREVVAAERAGRSL